MPWERTPPPIFEDEDEFELKLQFAAIVARNPDAQRTAGYRVFPGEENWGRALQAQAWLSDPFVQDEISRLRETGEAESLLPSIEVVKLEVLQRARAATDDKDAAALFKLYLESEGAIQKAGPQFNINDNRVVNVIRIPARVQTDEEREDFKRQFKQQQMKSIADARSNRPAVTV